jgi:hypothetical protein
LRGNDVGRLSLVRGGEEERTAEGKSRDQTEAAEQHRHEVGSHNLHHVLFDPFGWKSLKGIGFTRFAEGWVSCWVNNPANDPTTHEITADNFFATGTK